MNRDTIGNLLFVDTPACFFLALPSTVTEILVQLLFIMGPGISVQELINSFFTDVKIGSPLRLGSSGDLLGTPAELKFPDQILLSLG